MVKLIGDDAEIRRQSLRGSFYVQKTRGTLVLRAWPKKRPGPMSAKQQASVEKFTQAAMATKMMDAGDQTLARDLTKGTNALPRDLLMQALYGRLGTVFMDDGTRMYSMASLRDASGLLDIFTQQEGAILFRKSDFWWYLPIGLEGQVLKVGSDGLPYWGTGGGGGGAAWWNQPPSASLFTLISGDATNLVLADDTDAGLLVDGGATVSGDKVRGAWIDLTDPTGDWELTMRHQSLITGANYSYTGLAAYSSTSGRYQRCGLANNQNVYAADGTLTAFHSNIANAAYGQSNPWVRLAKVGTNLVSSVSAEGKLWKAFSTRAISSYLTNNPDKVGIIIGYNRSSGINTTLNVQYWNLQGSAV